MGHSLTRFSVILCHLWVLGATRTARLGAPGLMPAHGVSKS